MQLEPGLRCLTAPNPSPMTHRGTNTYIVGETEIAVIDPGPADNAHLSAILGALGPGQRITAILVTHSHLDHSPLARPLADATGAPILAAGPSDWGRRPVMQALATTGALGGGEGVDPDFTPDRQLADREIIGGDGWTIEALHTPGHMANHLSFAWNGALFSGDLVMGWATSVVSPPDGDMTAFFASLDRLAGREDRVHYPGHGDPVADPAARIAELATHRRGREAAITQALAHGPADPRSLTARIYTDVDARLLPMAERNVLAHLIDLAGRNLVTAEPEIAPDATFRLTAG
ncbi:MBL fold metallo-hydrolase [Rhodobacterales bacterium HKCCE3408]|nr:MBL fold metallo-hydrolase [Rhodobacterales bacterium HKCCE3408]